MQISRARSFRKTPRSLFDTLESRTLLSATLFVTAPGGTSDATHFQTLQSAIAAAAGGDTIVLQPGFAKGSFESTLLNGPATAGSTTLFTTAPLTVSEVVTIGAGNDADHFEKDLITAVTPTDGGYILTLASPLQFNHNGSPVTANNPDGGLIVGINKALTITTDGSADMTLPFNLRTWGTVDGVHISEHIFSPNHPKPVTPPPPEHHDPAPTPITETMTLTPYNRNVVVGQHLLGSIGHLADAVIHKPGDFTATVTFSDGITVNATLARVKTGGYEVIVARDFATVANLTYTINISDANASTSGQGTLTVLARQLTAAATNITTDSKTLHCVQVATFGDNLHSSNPKAYTVTITWSDGLTSKATMTRLGEEGNFIIKTSRKLPPGPATLTGTVTITTLDGLYSASTDFTVTINVPVTPSPDHKSDLNKSPK